MSREVISKLNQSHKFYDDPGEAANQFLKEYIKSISDEIENQINSYGIEVGHIFYFELL